MRISMITAAVVASLVGYGSTVALVLAAAAAVGADAAQTASWLLMISLAKGLGSTLLSTWTKVPVVLAWSTPGAALLATSTGVRIEEAVGAFVFAGVLLALTGLVRPLGRLVGAIPDGIAAAMLAGVLLPFCMKAALAAEAAPLLVLPMAGVFALVRLWNPAIAVLAALSTGVVLAFTIGGASLPALSLPAPMPVFIWPEWSAQTLIGLGVPLYLVTMASQNLPGFAVLRAHGYTPPVNRALGVTGALSAVTGLFGAHPVNVAAITAAICMGPDVHPDPKERWKVGIPYGVVWVLLGLFAPIIVALLGALPAEVMAALVGLALLSALLGALSGAYIPLETRFAATLTLAISASGVVALGIGAAFWGLMAGLLAHGLERYKR